MYTWGVKVLNECRDYHDKLTCRMERNLSLSLNALPQWSMIYDAASPTWFKNNVKQQRRQISPQIQNSKVCFVSPECFICILVSNSSAFIYFYFLNCRYKFLDI